MNDDLVTFRRILVELLVEFAGICEHIGTEWWLWGGTLLGAVRHGGFIPWDFDLDVCVRPDAINGLTRTTHGFVESVDPSFYGLFRQGTTMVNTSDARWMKRLMDRTYPCGIHVDVFPLFNVPDDTEASVRFFDSVRGKSFDEHNRLLGQTGTVSSMLIGDDHVPSGCFDRSTFAEFEGISFPVPERYDEVLTCLYGPSYMTPRQCNNPGVRHFVDVRRDWTEYVDGRLSIPPWEPCAASPSLMFAP